MDVSVSPAPRKAGLFPDPPGIKLPGGSFGALPWRVALPPPGRKKLFLVFRFLHWYKYPSADLHTNQKRSRPGPG